MKLTILGTFGPYPPAGGVCSGFLLEEGDCKILLDCGNGVISRLQKFTSLWDLDAIIVSHLHSDHISDLFILRYALNIALQKQYRTHGLDVYIPPYPEEEAQKIPFKNVYNVNYLDPNQEIEIGPFRFSFLPGVHPLYSLAMKIKCGGKVMVYSGDTEYFSELEQFIANSHLFLCEANYQNEDMEEGLGNHLSAWQAGCLAQNNKVGRLLLTHLPAFRNLHKSMAEAAEAFPNAELALEEEYYLI